MKAYADTSFLFCLYVSQVHSAVAAAELASLGVSSLPLTSFSRVELLNAVRLSVFRKQLSRKEIAATFQSIRADTKSGILALEDCHWPEVHARALQLSARHSTRGGHRGMDIIHVAVAQYLQVPRFLSFDRNQRSLAAAAGLTVGP